MTVEQALAELNRQAQQALREVFCDHLDLLDTAHHSARYEALLDAIEVVRKIHHGEAA